MKWLIKECSNVRLTKENSFSNSLVQQIDLAYQKKGNILNKKK